MQSTTVETYPSIERPGRAKLLSQKALNGFRRDSNNSLESITSGRFYDAKAAAVNTAKAPLSRKLKNRHLQMIAIGGAIDYVIGENADVLNGTGLFIGSGQALATGGPGSLLIAFIMVGIVVYCTVQALGEMAVNFPISGSFAAFSTRFLDPAWGFAMGWNYALQQMTTIPLEIMAASLALQFWNTNLSTAGSITIFIAYIVSINLFRVKVFAEAEYVICTIKIAAVVGFIILGVIINCAGGKTTGYIGGVYWQDPGAFNNGFKGLTNVLVTAAFAFSGTELVGLAAAETNNPTKAIPTAVKQVFWRISLFYIIAMLVVGLLVPYTNESLLSASSVDSKASPFVIAIAEAGIPGLDSVMNAVIILAVLSVANSSLYGSSRTLVALAEQGQAPKIFAYIDRSGRPLVSILFSASASLIAYIALSDNAGQAFSWLLALSGLSCIFSWVSICAAHIRFRQGWKAQGHALSELISVSPVGVTGSWIGFIGLTAILIVQFWIAADPIGADQTPITTILIGFFTAYLALPVVLIFYVVYKVYYRTAFVRLENMDLQSGINIMDPAFFIKVKEDKATWPMWKILYKSMC